MKKYRIKDNTLALVPFNKNKTIAYEDHNYYIIDDRVANVINDNCEYYGSSIDGRLKGTYSLVGFSYKAPIVMSEDNKMIFFPTCSPRLKDCAWINLKNILDISKLNDIIKTFDVRMCEKLVLPPTYHIYLTTNSNLQPKG